MQLLQNRILAILHYGMTMLLFRRRKAAEPEPEPEPVFHVKRVTSHDGLAITRQASNVVTYVAGGGGGGGGHGSSGTVYVGGGGKALIGSGNFVTHSWIGECAPRPFKEKKKRGAIQCHNCGAPVRSTELACSYCLTEHPL